MRDGLCSEEWRGGALVLSPQEATGFHFDPIVPFLAADAYGDRCRALGGAVRQAC